jgi:hypothetical protein
VGGAASSSSSSTRRAMEEELRQLKAERLARSRDRFLQRQQLQGSQAESAGGRPSR